MKERKININVIKRVAIVLAIMIVTVFILVKAGDFAKEKNDNTINLVINNRNVTERLKHDIKIKDGIIIDNHHSIYLLIWMVKKSIKK